MNELYSIFCILMRRNGKVQLKNLVSMSGLPLSKARKLLCELCNTKKIKRVGKGKGTYYTFA